MLNFQRNPLVLLTFLFLKEVQILLSLLLPIKEFQGTGSLTLFPGTPLLEEAKRGEFEPLSEKEMLEELKGFVENLTIDCNFITHHTVAANLTGPNFLKRKDKIISALDYAIKHSDMDKLALLRQNKVSL